MAVGGDEGVLHEVKGGGLVAEKFLGVGKERELITGEQGAPRGGFSRAGGGDGGHRDVGRDGRIGWVGIGEWISARSVECANR